MPFKDRLMNSLLNSQRSLLMFTSDGQRSNMHINELAMRTAAN